MKVRAGRWGSRCTNFVRKQLLCGVYVIMKDSPNSPNGGRQHIASLDVGTTSIRCHIVDKTSKTLATVTEAIQLLYPTPDRVEIAPEALWTSAQRVIRDALKEAGLTADQVILAMSCQRSTFVTWDKNTGNPFHNLITWKDLRADALVHQWNNSFTMMGIRFGSRCLYTLTGIKRFLAASVLRMMNAQVTLRFAWALKNIPELAAAAAKGEALFGTVDTWLVYCATAGKCHITDISMAAATGMFDPFTVRWANWAFQLFSIPPSMLPPVGDSGGDLAETDPAIWGASIPIRSMVADQSAAVFGSGCFEPESIQVTLGTGTFVDINTGSTPHASVKGCYPLVGWRMKHDMVYLAEGAANDTATIINWACEVGILDRPETSSELASSVPDSGGVFFVPAFSGLQAPINDHQAATGFIGVRPTTNRAHMARALIDSIVFRIAQLVDVMRLETGREFTRIRVSGGVSKNDLICQQLADLSGLDVERATSQETSALGAAYIAGLCSGLWSSTEEVSKMRTLERKFEPNRENAVALRNSLKRWERAVKRFLRWNEEDREFIIPASPSSSREDGGDASRRRRHLSI